MSKITVLTIADRISCFHTLKPFLFNNSHYKFTFTTSADFCLKKDKNKILIMVRWFIKPDRVDIELLKALRRKYERLIFFHDDAGGGIPRLEVLPYTDLFYTKALFKDRDLYRKPLYGKELYSDYYHRTYGVIDPDWYDRPVVTDVAQLDKLRLSWNIGIGDYPRDQFRQRAGYMTARYTGIPVVKLFYRKHTVFTPEMNTGKYDIHCRVGLISRPSISYQRKLILDTVKNDPSFLTDMVPQRQFNQEIKHSKITISPFGWGELCLRDFEAVQNGSLMLKPDMSHLETWPNVFVPAETYVPFDWDVTNLRDIAHQYLNDESERKRITKNAFAAYTAALNSLDDRFAAIMKEIVS